MSPALDPFFPTIGREQDSQLLPLLERASFTLINEPYALELWDPVTSTYKDPTDGASSHFESSVGKGTDIEPCRFSENAKTCRNRQPMEQNFDKSRSGFFGLMSATWPSMSFLIPQQPIPSGATELIDPLAQILEPGLNGHPQCSEATACDQHSSIASPAVRPNLPPAPLSMYGFEESEMDRTRSGQSSLSGMPLQKLPATPKVAFRQQENQKPKPKPKSRADSIPLLSWDRKLAPLPRRASNGPLTPLTNKFSSVGSDLYRSQFAEPADDRKEQETGLTYKDLTGNDLSDTDTDTDSGDDSDYEDLPAPRAAGVKRKATSQGRRSRRRSICEPGPDPNPATSRAVAESKVGPNTYLCDRPVLRTRYKRDAHLIGSRCKQVCHTPGDLVRHWESLAHTSSGGGSGSGAGKGDGKRYRCFASGCGESYTRKDALVRHWGTRKGMGHKEGHQSHRGPVY